MPSQPVQSVKLKRSGAKLVAVLLGIGALGVGGALAFTFVQKDLDKTTPPPAAAAPPVMPTPPPTPPTPPPPKTPAVAPTPTPPPPETPTANPPPPETPTATFPKGPKGPPVQQVVKHPAGGGTPTNVKHNGGTAVKDTPPKDETPKPPPTDKKDPKDPQWNLDSPFLPPKP
jgi:hypothetical protein